jgi:AraC family transcriptional regulator, regulatory protein of adaptative response / methylated-DNA-[protein]-cysteine methyltransferase
VNDFERVARVIRHLDKHREQQPGLQELSEVAGLSESHFHRLFQRWAGITPKDFLQCLTAEFAKRRLRDSASVLDAALEAGLSGPGRLHDLMVTLEAASPGEVKSKGAGLRIEWGVAESPFGVCSIGWTERGISHLAFCESEEAAVSELAKEWSAARLERNDRSARAKAAVIFNPTANGAGKLRAYVRGSSFQLKVWRALLRIPPGCVATYGRIARAIGAPNAVRAVGTACGSNPVAYLIPCHRVIRETGIVQGYAWGSDRKQAMLAWEGRRVNNLGGKRLKAEAVFADNFNS